MGGLLLSHRYYTCLARVAILCLPLAADRATPKVLVRIMYRGTVTESKLLHGWDVDERLAWSPGRASSLAARRKLPHVLLPDGQIGFRWKDIEPLVQAVPRQQGDKR